MTDIIAISDLARGYGDNVLPEKIADLCLRYSTSNPSLAGIPLTITPSKVRLLTCDSWKAKCSGLPTNAFVLLLIKETAQADIREVAGRAAILCRVSGPCDLPDTMDSTHMLHQASMAGITLDSLTQDRLRWSGLELTVLGTYYDGPNGEIAFGGDVQMLASTQYYAAYSPEPGDLEKLINHFVRHKPDVKRIGRVRYTQTEMMAAPDVPVCISPADFIASRTALFGKTRFGKSNTFKIILKMMLESSAQVAQIVFDPSGEYTYPDKQTGASLYAAYRDRISRYSLTPRHPESERLAGLPPPNNLRVNFYDRSSLPLAIAIMQGLWDTAHKTRPDYLAPILRLEIPTKDEEEELEENERNRLTKTIGMLNTLFYRARLTTPKGFHITLGLNKDVRREIQNSLAKGSSGAADTPSSRLRIGENGVMEDYQPIEVCPSIYRALYALLQLEKQRVKDQDAEVSKSRNRTRRLDLDEREDEEHKPIFGLKSERPYFDDVHEALLRVLGNEQNSSGPKKFMYLKDYHADGGQNVLQQIEADINANRTVFLDTSQGDPDIGRYYADLICEHVRSRQVRRFAEIDEDEFEATSILFYFEEAHVYFPRQNNDLTNVFNRMAKEGGKFRIGMVFATQSPSTISADLVGMTENRIIAHLSDIQETQVIEKSIEFVGHGEGIQRAKTKGFVRLLTQSHAYALPVQIDRFVPPAAGDLSRFKNRAQTPPSGDGSALASQTQNVSPMEPKAPPTGVVAHINEIMRQASLKKKEEPQEPGQPVGWAKLLSDDPDL